MPELDFDFTGLDLEQGDIFNTLTNVTVETEGLLPGQTPLRITNDRMRDWNTIQGVPVDRNANIPQDRRNFFFVEPGREKEVIYNQWKNYFVNPQKYGMSPNATIEDAVRTFDQERPENKLNRLKQKGIDTKRRLADFDAGQTYEGLELDFEPEYDKKTPIAEQAYHPMYHPMEKLVESLSIGVARFGASLPQVAGGIIREVGERAEEPPSFFQKITEMPTTPAGVPLMKLKSEIFKRTNIDEKVAEFGKKITQANKKFIAKHFPRPDEKTEQFIEDLGAGAGSLALAVGISLATKNTSAAAIAFGIIAKGRSYEEAREAEKSPEFSGNLSSAVGLGEGFLEKIGLDFMLKRYGNPIASVLIKAVSEAIQEGSQSLSENILMTIGGVRKFLGLKPMIEEAVYEASIGAILGGSASVALSGMETELSEQGIPEKAVKAIRKRVEKGVGEAVESMGKGLEEDLKESKEIPIEEATIAPKAGTMIHEVPPYVKKVMEKGVEVVGRDAPIAIDKDITVKDIHGNKVKLPAGEEYTPFKLSNNKVWLHDGKNIVVDKNQYEQAKGQGTVLEGFPMKKEAHFKKVPIKQAQKTGQITHETPMENVKSIIKEGIGEPFFAWPGHQVVAEWVKKDVSAIIQITIPSDLREFIVKGMAEDEVSFVGDINPKWIDKVIEAKTGNIIYEKGKGFIKPKMPKAGVKPVGKAEAFEEPITEPLLNYPNPSFNKHMKYIEKIQLPEDSKIFAIKRQINEVRGKRLAGTITPQRANQLVRKLNKQLKATAKKEGIAFRMTRGGTLSLAVRRTGAYVPVEFAEYDNFEDVRAIAGGGTDITRTIQKIDGSLTIAKKKQLKGQAGQAEQYILWRTRDISKNKIAWIENQAKELQKIVQGIKPKSAEDYALTALLRKISSDLATNPSAMLLQDPEITNILRDFSEATRFRLIESAQKGRLLYDDMVNMQNMIREQFNLPDIGYIRNYSPEQIRDTSVWGKISNLQKKIEDIMAKKAPLPDYIKPDKPFNPRAEARKNGIPYEEQEMSFTKLLEDYIVTASKDMFNTAIIQNNKAFIEQLRTMGIKNSSDTLSKWTTEAFAGVEPTLDRYLNLPPQVKGAMRIFNRARNLGVFAFNLGWSAVTQTQSLALTIGRYGANNTTKGVIDWLRSPNLRGETANKYYSYIVKAQKGGRASQQDVDNLMGSKVRTYKSPIDRIEDVGYFIIYELEKILTGSSIRAAELYGSKKGLTGQALDEFASDGGGKTQSMYNDEDRPGVLRGLLIKTAAPFQTFGFEMINTMKEWAGKTGTPPDTAAERIGTVMRFMVATAVMQSLAYGFGKRKFWLYDLSTMPMPFSEFWLSPIIAAITGKWSFTGAYLTSPVQTAQDLGLGVRDVITHGSWRRLRRVMVRYAPGLFGVPGGGMAERVTDALIAYGQGGVKSKKGEITKQVTDPWDAVKMTFFGTRALTTKAKDEGIELGIDIDIGGIDFGGIEF